MNKILSTWFNRYLSQPEAIVLVVIFVVVVLVFKIMGQILVPIITSMILSYLLFGVVKWFEKWHFPHLLAVILVFLLFMGLLLLAFFWLLPLLWEEVASLVSEIPAILSRGQELIFKIHDRFPELVSDSQLQQVVPVITDYLVNLGRGIVTFSLASLFSIVTLIVYLILVPLLVFFFLRDGRDIVKWFTGFLPRKRQVLQDVWHELQGKVHNYIHGKIVEVIIVTIVATVTFWIFKLQYTVLFGALVGLSVVIPYVGIVVVTIPIVMVGLIQWGLSEHFLYLMLVHAVINILDANVLVPILFSEAMNLHPLAIILAVLVSGNLFGFWGVFFAIPLVTLVNIIVKFWPKGDVYSV